MEDISPISEEPYLLSMQVEIGDGRKDRIFIKEEDNPEALAREFAIKHSVDRVLESHLVTLIKLHKEEKLQQLLAAGSESQIQQSKRCSVLHPEGQAKTTFQKIADSFNQPERSIKTSKSMANMNSKLSNHNFGVSLYKKDLEWKQNKKQVHEELREKKEEEFRESTLTFKPLISEQSTILASRTFENHERHLLKLGSERNKRIESLENLGIRKEMEECSFQPNIHKKHNWSSSSNLANTLHEDASERKIRKENQSQLEFEENFRFEPNLQLRVAKHSAKQQEELADRLIQSKKQKEEKLEKERSEKLESEIGKPLSKISRTGSANIHEKLFQESKKKRNFASASLISTKPEISGKSNKIYDLYRGKQYAKLFSIMDSDEDGVISSAHINIDDLDLKVLTILTPLFAELDEGDVMDIEAFIKVVEDIWENLTVEERAILIKRESKSLNGSENISSLVSERSTILAMKKRGDNKESLYERTINAEKIVEMKKQKKRELIEAENKKECTFRPNLKKRE